MIKLPDLEKEIKNILPKENQDCNNLDLLYLTFFIFKYFNDIFCITKAFDVPVTRVCVNKYLFIYVLVGCVL